MMRLELRPAFTTGAVLCLAACSAADTSASDEAMASGDAANAASIGMSAPAKAQSNTGADAFSGTWKRGQTGSIEIRRASGRNSYEMDMAIFAPPPGGGCGGSVEGTGTARGNVLTIVAPALDEFVPRCVMKLTRRGNGLDVKQGDDCYHRSGASCEFDGRYTLSGRTTSRNSQSGADAAAQAEADVLAEMRASGISSQPFTTNANRYAWNVANYDTAYVRSDDDPAVFLMVSCGESGGHAPRVDYVSLGIENVPHTLALRKQLFGPSGQAERPIGFRVSGRTKGGQFQFMVDQTTGSHGGAYITAAEAGRDISIEDAGGSISRTHLRALRQATFIAVNVSGKAYSFSTRGSARAIDAMLRT